MTLVWICLVLALLIVFRRGLALLALCALQFYVADRRPPDLVVGGAADPYLRRWYLIPRNPWLNLYLHNVLRDDDDRALHDHPWANLSWILDGGYFESLPRPGAARRFRDWRTPQLPFLKVYRAPGSLILRPRPTQAHRLILTRRVSSFNSGEPGGLAGGAGHQIVRPAWTLFLTGPRRREWGFHCQRGWVHWRQFTAGPRGEMVGAGCDQDWDARAAEAGAANDNAAERAPDGLVGGIGHSNKGAA
jgi:hypothetical protein